MRTIAYWLALGSADLPQTDDWLGAWERAQLAGMRVPKRRSDFLLGRWTAKRLATHSPFGLPQGLDRIDVRADADGAPRVLVDGRPAPIAISITHSGALAGALAAAQPAVVGCDLETIAPRSAALIADFFTEDEARTIARAAPDQAPLWATLIWSAKESALKLLRSGLRRDTREVRVSFDPQSARQAGWRRLTVELAGADRTLHGWWCEVSGALLTAVCDPPCAAPLSVAPPPIER